ncbi:MAG: T9SS type A sorting domain-containing protein [Bacteroidota bacterium]|nr:T9SS type A sorting domain-containing protein [Bacteroidota bacterium]
MKKHLLSLAASLLVAGSAFAQFTAAQIWSLNLRVDPMPHNTINMMYFDMTVNYNSRGVPVSGLSTAQPGLPLPEFKISSSIEGNKVICISQEKEGNEPWENVERATFENDGTHDTAIIIERSNDGEPFALTGKIVIEQLTSSGILVHKTYLRANETWALSSKEFYYLTATRLDSMVRYKFNSSTDSLRNSYTYYYYSTGLDSSLHSILQTSTNEFEVQNKILVLQKEAGKTKQFAVEARNTTGGPFQRTATFTYKNTASSLQEMAGINGLNLYPNPVSDKLHISIPKSKTVLAARLLNIKGETLKTVNNSNEVDVQELPQGVYFIQIETAENVITQKFIKN